MFWHKIVERQEGYVNFTRELIQACGKTMVAIIGTGGNGAVLDYLVRVGYQNFEIVDFDAVEVSNLNRLPFTLEDVGKRKVDAWEEYLKEINPECKVTAYCKKITKNDYEWMRALIKRVDIVALGTTDFETNFLVARVCNQLKKRMVIGPGTSGFWVITTFTHTNGISLENIADFDTENIDVKDINYKALFPRYMKLISFPGRPEKLYPEVLQGVLKGEIPARSCKIFVSMVNAAMCWEIIKNTAIISGIHLQNTTINEIPIIQVFDPYKGSAYYYNILKKKIGIPNWLTGEIQWCDYKS